jgi:hypothetical protein
MCRSGQECGQVEGQALVDPRWGRRGCVTVLRAGGDLQCLVAVGKSPVGAGSSWDSMVTAWGSNVCRQVGGGVLGELWAWWWLPRRGRYGLAREPDTCS